MGYRFSERIVRFGLGKDRSKEFLIAKWLMLDSQTASQRILYKLEEKSVKSK